MESKPLETTILALQVSTIMGVALEEGPPQILREVTTRVPQILALMT
jgi:hypothetical protein